jgi:hypothetical protein
MDDLKDRAAALHQDALVWDSHACLPLHPDADLDALERHRRAGVDFVSVNVGMDMNPLSQILTVIASFRAQLQARPERFVRSLRRNSVRRRAASRWSQVSRSRLSGGLARRGSDVVVDINAREALDSKSEPLLASFQSSA